MYIGHIYKCRLYLLHNIQHSFCLFCVSLLNIVCMLYLFFYQVRCQDRQLLLYAYVISPAQTRGRYYVRGRAPGGGAREPRLATHCCEQVTCSKYTTPS